MQTFKTWTCGEVRQVMTTSRKRAAMLCATRLEMPPPPYSLSPRKPIPDDQRLYFVSYCDRRDGGHLEAVSGETPAIEAYLEIYSREHTLVAQLLKHDGGIRVVEVPGCRLKHQAEAMRAHIGLRKARQALSKNTSDFVLMPKKLSDVTRRRQGRQGRGNFEVISK